jgi:hypothetical protein
MKEGRVKEIQGMGSERRRNEPCGEPGEGLNSINGIDMNEGWIRDEVWTKEPTRETVERLIEWFSDDRK